MKRFVILLTLWCGALFGAPAPVHCERQLILDGQLWRVFRSSGWTIIKFLGDGVYRAENSYGCYYGRWSYINRRLTIDDEVYELTHDPLYKSCWMDVRSRSYLYLRR